MIANVVVSRIRIQAPVDTQKTITIDDLVASVLNDSPYFSLIDNLMLAYHLNILE